MFKGNNQINQIYKGNTLISKVYKGDTLIYPSDNVFEDATVAYSLRDLELGATHVVKVRRPSDNLEQNFTANQIIQSASTSGSLLYFCGSGDGFVTIWYDQKGLQNASQSTASNQPKIVFSGSLITENGKPTLEFDGTSQYLTAGLGNSLSYGNDLSFFRVINSNTVDTNRRIMSDDKVGVQGYFIDYFITTATLRVNDGSGYKQKGFSLLSTDTQSLYSTIFNGETGDIFNKFNTLTETDNIGSFSPPIKSSGDAGFAIGSAANGGQYFDGKIQEIICFNIDKSEERTDIETNINNHYAIY